ncbi:hypothetical protein GGS26DRAFT_590424 [Hypomontagnella submonticulosa]|nr:hypothetical protein GGS26DRAFT_590424 [Hypomontagnella submonticulosa]
MQLSKVSIAALAMFIGLTVAAPLTGDIALDKKASTVAAHVQDPDKPTAQGVEYEARVF